MELWLESTLGELYASAVEAFPETARRQHSTHTVRVEHVDWVPFKGLGTLFVKGLCNNEGRKNECIVLFKGVRYMEVPARRSVALRASDGREVNLEALSGDKNEVMVRCSCPDFRWRFSHWDRVDGSLYGRGPRVYHARLRPGSSNPKEMPGMCKHLMKMAKIMADSGVFGG